MSELPDELQDAPNNPENWRKLDEELTVLWEQRRSREDNFGDLICVLQCVVRYYRHTLTWRQMNTVWALTNYVREKKNLEDADLRLANQLISVIGLNSYCGLSEGPPAWEETDQDAES